MAVPESRFQDRDSTASTCSQALLHDSAVPPRDRLIAYMNWVAKLGGNDPDSMLLPILISLEFLETGNEAERLVAGHYEAIYAALAAALEDGRRKGVFNKRSAVREQACCHGRQSASNLSGGICPYRRRRYSSLRHV